jgi:hypothetical protein
LSASPGDRPPVPLSPVTPLLPLVCPPHHPCLHRRWLRVLVLGHSLLLACAAFAERVYSHDWLRPRRPFSSLEEESIRRGDGAGGEVERRDGHRKRSTLDHQLPRVSDRSKDPDFTLRLCGRCSGRRGRWKDGFSAARWWRWKSIGGVLADRPSSRPLTPLQGGCTHLAWDHARGCTVVCWSPVFNARPHTTSSGYGHPVRTRTRARQEPPSRTSSWP